MWFLPEVTRRLQEVTAGYSSSGVGIGNLLGGGGRNNNKLITVIATIFLSLN